MRNQSGDGLHRHPHDQYTDLDSVDSRGPGLRQLEMAHTKSNCAFVPRGNRDLVNDGIYLSIELEQNSRQVSASHQGEQESV